MSTRPDLALALILLICAGCSTPPSTASTASAEAAQRAPAGATPWTGDCPSDDGGSAHHLVLIELSPSELDAQILARRRERITRHAQQAADCEAEFSVVALMRGRAEVIYDHHFDSPLGTEVARDRQVDDMAAAAMAEIEPLLAQQAQLEPQPGSDPGAAYRVLDDQLRRIGPDGTIDALILSDGVTRTESIDLNQPLDDNLDELVTLVAPAVDLDQRVRIDWPDVGRTADPAGPPGAWLDQLRLLWQRVCESRNAATCLHTTI